MLVPCSLQATALPPVGAMAVAKDAPYSSSLQATALPPVGAARAPAQSATPDSLVHRVAVFGRDNRTRLPKHLDALRSSIGLIYNERTRTVCSAFCVGDDMIATASHCVFRTKGESPPPPERFVFMRPGTSEGAVRFAGADNRTSFNYIVAGTAGIKTKPPIDAARDWALARLQKPACRGHALDVLAATPDEIEAEAQSGHLFQAAFHRDFGKWSLTYSDPCFGGRRGEANVAGPKVNERDFNDPLNLVLHSCDTGGASSGSPLLIETPSGPKVVAINVGTFVQSRVMIQDGVVVKRARASPVANTAVSGVAFAARIAPFAGASILTSTADLRALQRLLIMDATLDGPAKGRFDVPTRQAIERYEAQAGLPVLGVPTRELLERMQRNVPMR